MIVDINNKVYDMDKQSFNALVQTVEEAKKGSFCIFCLVSSRYAHFIDENFETKEAMRVEVANFVKQGFKVLYTTKD